MKIKLNDSLLNKEVFFIYYKGLKDNYDFINETIVSYFNALELIQIDETHFAIVVESLIYPIEDSLHEILDLFGLDFNLDLKFLIGNKTRYTKENLSLINQEIKYLDQTSKTLSTVTELYIQETVKTSLNPDILYPVAFNLIQEEPEIKEMIAKLWETSANIAQCASELYVHRNTLIYRMDKFEKDTQLNLKNQNDLLISYLLTLRSQ